MKVNFAADFTDNKAVQEKYKKIKDTIVKLGNTITPRNHDRVSMHKVLTQSDEENKKAYRLISQSMKNSDVFIADISLPNVGLGYEIAEALAERKPTLVIRDKKVTDHPAVNIKANTSKLVTYAEYENEKDLEKIISNFLREAKGKLDTKFILIISPDIDKYLKWASDEYRMHKAQIVRDAIEDKIKKDKEYKDYLKLVA